MNALTTAIMKAFASGALPLAYFVIVAAIWFSSVICNSLLLRRFTARYPDEARRRLPWATSGGRHPENFFYFLRAEAKPFLQADPALWKLHRRFMRLAVASLLLWLVPFLALACVLLYVATRKA